MLFRILPFAVVPEMRSGLDVGCYIFGCYFVYTAPIFIRAVAWLPWWYDTVRYGLYGVLKKRLK